MIRLHTSASGQFSVYVPTYNSELELIARSENLVVNNGLNAVGTQTWASCLQRCLGGNGTTPVQPTDTTMGNLLLSSTNAATSMPPSYTLVDVVTSSAYPGLSSLVYRIGRTWRLENYTSSNQTIKELGVSITPSGSASLFSRSVLPSTEWFTISAGRFAYVIYELRLDLGISSTTQSFSATTDGNIGFNFPPTAQIGLFNCPVAYLESDASVQNNNLTNGQALFEPSNSTYYLYYLRGVTNPASTTYFVDKRNWVYTNQATLLADLNAGGSGAGINPSYTQCHSHTNAHVFANDDNGTYQNNTFKRTRHIIVPPEVPSLNENIWGFAVINQASTTNIAQKGLHCNFINVPWNRPINVFTKFYFEQTWSATP